MRLYILGLQLALLVFGSTNCLDRTGVSEVSTSVVHFRERVKNGNLQAIVEDASPEFRNAINSQRSEFEAKLAQFRLEIGNPNNSDLIDYEERYQSNVGTLVFLRYRGLGNGRVLSEEYVFKLDGKVYRLFNYEFVERKSDR
jgi:hypothetical protein